MDPSPVNILLVEDEPDVRAIAEGILSSFGYGVTPVANGAEALAALNGAAPDLILCDVRMPVIDGFQLLQKVRVHPTWHQIPFVIVSAKAESADLRMGMSLGADDYVTKPYQPTDLKKAIEVRLQRAKKVSDAIASNRRLLTHLLPHELRTPLTGVIGYADLMIDAASDGRTLTVDELSEYGRMLQQSGARIFRIVENLLFWARLEAAREGQTVGGKAPSAREKVVPSELCLLAETIARQFERHKDIVLDCPAEASIHVVTPGFEFITSHIVENAFKYSLPGTPVRVTARRNERMFALHVTDSGRGINPEQIARVGMFRQFERNRFEQQGLGMGLMLATTFAGMSGGHFELQAGPEGKGLVATLSLPLDASMAAA
jgi:two-component system, sensor histidine kinase and response regulator